MGKTWTLLAGITLLCSCLKRNPEYCEMNAQCKSSDAPFCDVDGQYEGVAHQCIATPTDAGVLDVGEGDGQSRRDAIAATVAPKAVGKDCANDAECASKHCKGKCCITTCKGSCATCDNFGQCLPKNELCNPTCSLCKLQGDTYTCDASYCRSCSTSASAAFTGTCGNGKDVLLPHGCVYSHTVHIYGGAGWTQNSETCNDGTWSNPQTIQHPYFCLNLPPYHTCPTNTRWDDWTDGCGNSSQASVNCP